MNAPVIGRKPAWWLLYTDAVALVALIGVIEVAVVGEATRLMLEMVTVIVTFVFDAGVATCQSRPDRARGGARDTPGVVGDRAG